MEGHVRELGVGPEVYWWMVHIVKVKQKMLSFVFFGRDKNDLVDLYVTYFCANLISIFHPY